MTNLHQLGEFGLNHRLNERLAVRPGVRLGIGDDAALLESPVVTTLKSKKPECEKLLLIWMHSFRRTTCPSLPSG